MPSYEHNRCDIYFTNTHALYNDRWVRSPHNKKNGYGNIITKEDEKKFKNKLIKYGFNNSDISLILLFDVVVIIFGSKVDTIEIYEIINTTDTHKSYLNLCTILNNITNIKLQFKGHLCIINANKKKRKEEINKIKNLMLKNQAAHIDFIPAPPKKEIDNIPEYNDIRYICNNWSINTQQLIETFFYFKRTYGKNVKININDGRIKFIINEKIIYFNRYRDKSSQKTLKFWNHFYKFTYKKIENEEHISYFEHLFLIINKLNIKLYTFIHHKSIKNSEDRKRRKTGEWFINEPTAKLFAEIIMKYNKPEILFETCGGIGGIIDPFLNHTDIIIINDLKIETCKYLFNKYEKYDNVTITNMDIVKVKESIKNKTEYLIKKLNITKDINTLIDKDTHICTNVPYGSKLKHNITVEKIPELIKYGTQDLLQPAIGRNIEIVLKLNIKTGKNKYLDIILPASVLHGKTKYNPILGALLTNFEFKESHIVSGSNFGASPIIPITLSVWKYHKNFHTNFESLEFHYEDKIIHVKQFNLLLKDGWDCDNRKKIHGEIAIYPHRSYNNPKPKIIHNHIERGGSEMVPDNVKVELNISNVPSHVFYGMWSKLPRIATIPLYVRNAYPHIPDIIGKKELEIITYSALYTLMDKLRITNKFKLMGEGDDWSKIIDFSKNGTIIFGGKFNTDPINYLFKKYGYCKMGEKTITEVINEFQNNLFDNKKRLKYVKLIREEVDKRLDEIGYWNFIPIPRNLFKKKEKIINKNIAKRKTLIELLERN